MIDCDKNWLSIRVAVINARELCQLYKDIYDFHKTGVLAENSEMRTIAEEFEREISGEYNLRIVEQAILNELGRRFYNNFEANNGEIV